MYNGLKYTFIFLGGAVVGAVVASKMLKAKYEQIAQEEIDSVRAMYSEAQGCCDTENNEEENADPAEIAKAAKEKPDIRDYAAKIQAENYFDYSGITSNSKEEEVTDVDKPKVISPEEFEELANEHEYDVINLTYYANKVLTDELDEPMDDIEGAVGLESLEHFGDYPEDPDTVYVRNDRRKTVYEICQDTQDYPEDSHLDNE